MLKIGVIGYGYWGSKILSKLKFLNDSFEIKFICDSDLKKLYSKRKTYRIIKNYRDGLKFGKLDAVFICTNPISHFKISNFFLDNNVNVFVEKPICSNIKQFNILKNKAIKKRLIIYEDLIFLHDEKIKMLNKIVNKKSFGKPILYNSVRSNLGGFQFNTNVIDDLLTHDLSILFMMFNNKIKKINCILHKTIKKLPGSVAYITIKLSGNFLVNFSFSWHSPLKIRQINIVGSKKMINFDGLMDSAPIKILNKSFRFSNNRTFDYRIGDIKLPNIQNKKEPLINTILAFKEIVEKKIIYNKYIKLSEIIIKTKQKIKIQNF